MIFRASILSVDEKPEKKNWYQVLHCHFFFRNVRILGVLVFYRVANLPIEIVCIIKNFEEADCGDFKIFKRLTLAWSHSEYTNTTYNPYNLLASLRPGSHLGANARAAKSECQRRSDPAERSLVRRRESLSQVWKWSNSSQQHPTCRNTSQHVDQTHATCCAQQCSDMLRCHVAIVWLGLKSARDDGESCCTCWTLKQIRKHGKCHFLRFLFLQNCGTKTLFSLRNSEIKAMQCRRRLSIVT